MMEREGCGKGEHYAEPLDALGTSPLLPPSLSPSPNSSSPSALSSKLYG